MISACYDWSHPGYITTILFVGYWTLLEVVRMSRLQWGAILTWLYFHYWLRMCSMFNMSEFRLFWLLWKMVGGNFIASGYKKDWDAAFGHCPLCPCQNGFSQAIYLPGGWSWTLTRWSHLWGTCSEKEVSELLLVFLHFRFCLLHKRNWKQFCSVCKGMLFLTYLSLPQG